jgi:hypothetical protein
MTNSSALEFKDFLTDREYSQNQEIEIETSNTWKKRELPPQDNKSNILESKIVSTDDIFTKYQLVKTLCCDTEAGQTRLQQAVSEGINILNSGIFPEFVKPSTAIDEYGEFSISIKRPNGYLDIGVCGDNTISYHVRNDEDISKTKFGDTSWDGRSLPNELIYSIIHLVEN